MNSMNFATFYCRIRLCVIQRNARPLLGYNHRPVVLPRGLSAHVSHPTPCQKFNVTIVRGNQKHWLSICGYVTPSLHWNFYLKKCPMGTCQFFLCRIHFIFNLFSGQPQKFYCKQFCRVRSQTFNSTKNSRQNRTYSSPPRISRKCGGGCQQ